MGSGRWNWLDEGRGRGRGGERRESKKKKRRSDVHPDALGWLPAISRPVVPRASIRADVLPPPGHPLLCVCGCGIPLVLASRSTPSERLTARASTLDDAPARSQSSRKTQPVPSSLASGVVFSLSWSGVVWWVGGVGLDSSPRRRRSRRTDATNTRTPKGNERGRRAPCTRTAAAWCRLRTCLRRMGERASAASSRQAFRTKSSAVTRQSNHQTRTGEEPKEFNQIQSVDN